MQQLGWRRARIWPWVAVPAGALIPPDIRARFPATSSSTSYADIPGVIDCTFGEEWNEFRIDLQRNSKAGSPFEEHIFVKADRLISKHLLTFLQFHREKSNEFFFDCARKEPHGIICLYGMLSAFLVHHVYLRDRIAATIALGEAVDDGERQVYAHSTNLARHLIINKNNCLDFLDSSGWPMTLQQVVELLRPAQGSDDEFSFVREASGREPPSIRPPPWPRFSLQTATKLQSNPVPSRLTVYITGTHAALAKEVSEMLLRFGGPLLGCAEVVPVLEVEVLFQLPVSIPLTASILSTRW